MKKKILLLSLCAIKIVNSSQEAYDGVSNKLPANPFDGTQRELSFADHFYSEEAYDGVSNRLPANPFDTTQRRLSLADHFYFEEASLSGDRAEQRNPTAPDQVSERSITDSLLLNRAKLASNHSTDHSQTQPEITSGDSTPDSVAFKKKPRPAPLHNSCHQRSVNLLIIQKQNAKDQQQVISKSFICSLFPCCGSIDLAEKE